MTISAKGIFNHDTTFLDFNLKADLLQTLYCTLTKHYTRSTTICSNTFTEYEYTRILSVLFKNLCGKEIFYCPENAIDFNPV